MSNRRGTGVAIVAVGIAVFAAVPAQAQSADQWFANAVTKMNLPLAPDTDLPALGKGVCSMLDNALASSAVNPVPAVRGVLTTLTSKGLEREQAGSLLKASVTAYCPQHTRFIGR